MVCDENIDLFMISVVSEMLGIHPQTLRLYEREGSSSRRGPEAIPGCIPKRTWKSSK